MALTTVRQNIIVGSQVYETVSGTVIGAPVSRGMLLEAVTGTDVRPASLDSTRVVGVALYNSPVGGRVTYVVPSCDVRVMLTGGQSVAVGDRLQATSITIGTITTNGHVGRIVPPVPSATYVQSEALAAINYNQRVTGIALESRTTAAGVAAVIKMRLIHQG